MARRSKTQWQQIIKAQGESGLTAAEYCRRNNVNAKYFSHWKNKLKSAKAPVFVSVEPTMQSVNELATINIRVLELSVSLKDLNSVLASLRC